MKIKHLISSTARKVSSEVVYLFFKMKTIVTATTYILRRRDERIVPKSTLTHITKSHAKSIYIPAALAGSAVSQ